ncbi:MAG: hypothetical protein RIQ81_2080 [Pseudomonadota bacterium]
MAKYVTLLVAALVAAFMYRTADVYFTERRLRHAVWNAMDPAVRDDEATKQLVLQRIKGLGVEVNPDELKISVEEKPESDSSIGGVVQVFKKTMTATFPFRYRKMGAEKKGVMTIKRESANKGAVAVP